MKENQRQMTTFYGKEEALLISEIEKSSASSLPKREKEALKVFLEKAAENTVKAEAGYQYSYFRGRSAKD